MTCQNVGGTVLTAISDSDKPQDHLGDPPSTSMTDEVLIIYKVGSRGNSGESATTTVIWATSIHHQKRTEGR